MDFEIDCSRSDLVHNSKCIYCVIIVPFFWTYTICKSLCLYPRVCEHWTSWSGLFEWGRRFLSFLKLTLEPCMYYNPCIAITWPFEQMILLTTAIIKLMHNFVHSETERPWDCKMSKFNREYARFCQTSWPDNPEPGNCDRIMHIWCLEDFNCQSLSFHIFTDKSKSYKDKNQIFWLPSLTFDISPLSILNDVHRSRKQTYANDFDHDF